MNIPTPMSILTFVGVVYLSYLLLRLLNFIHLHFFHRSRIALYRHNHHSSAASPWAIITGSTDGIGLAYAHALADLNFNIVLHGRNDLKLHHVRHELQTTYPHLQFEILLLDASNSGEEAREHMIEAVEELKELHVTVLINNVGTGIKTHGPIMEAFAESEVEDIDALLNINARFPVLFTRAVLPLMLSHGGPALIMTMGSLAEYGLPYMTTYSCAKSPDLAFSRALRREMMAEGMTNVEVLGIMVAGVTDTAWDKSPSNLFRPKSGEFAKKALEMVGCGVDVVTPWWSHGIVWEVLECCPSWLLDWGIVVGSKRMMENPQFGKKV